MERNFYLAFSAFPGIGPIKFNQLLKKFGTAKSSWNATNLDLKKILGEKLTVKFEKYKTEFSINHYLKLLEHKRVSFIILTDKEYPQRLLKINNPPILLYVKGEIDFNSSKFLAVVGTRRITRYGEEVTRILSGELAQGEVVIVSGLAMGVDGVAHKSAIEAGGKTIAVMGNGVDMCFPSSNQSIYDSILEGNGSIISEFPPGMSPNAGSFPARNRIVAGISDGVLVTEGASDSGSLITANYGLEFGRKVFAVPGPITSSLSAAPLKLIEKGAKLVLGADDILKELGVRPTSIRLRGVKGDTKEEQKIIDLLQNESLNFDEIVRRLKLDSSQTGSLLSVMEMKGIIKSVDGGNFSLVNS